MRRASTHPARCDEGGVLERASDAVFDHVSLTGGEDELAVSDIDLAAAEKFTA